MANVTYVPVGYLLTRGQTIKVTSQILRKARQMGYFVPHTNFNEDSYGSTLRTFDPVAQYAKVGEYVQILSPDINPSNKFKSNVMHAKITDIRDEGTILSLSSATELTSIHRRARIVFKCGKWCNSKQIGPETDVAEEDGFTGACVLEAKPGLMAENVAVLDFASLYPTIIMSRNLCYSTFVMDERFADCPGVEYETIAWHDEVEYTLNRPCETVLPSGKRVGEKCGKPAFYLHESKASCRIHDPLKKARSEDEKHQKKPVDFSFRIVQSHQGVLPALLEDLYSERKRVKREMKVAHDAGDTVLAEILDKTQLGIKVSLNSVYGFLGRRQGNLVLKELGSIVTAVGRKLIDETVQFSETVFPTLIEQHEKAMHTLRPVDLSGWSHQAKEDFLRRTRL
ncbi:DNA polymerase delta catalytic subunit [Podochytrium sp. JEL0797]|nr:DNA polymerase delta catalytic subunit [Podochytrium sp. JEL0797]